MHPVASAVVYQDLLDVLNRRKKQVSLGAGMLPVKQQRPSTPGVVDPLTPTSSHGATRMKVEEIVRARRTAPIPEEAAPASTAQLIREEVAFRRKLEKEKAVDESTVTSLAGSRKASHQDAFTLGPRELPAARIAVAEHSTRQSVRGGSMAGLPERRAPVYSRGSVGFTPS